MKNSNNKLLFQAYERSPKNYPWWLCGIALGLLAIVLFINYYPF